MNPQAKEFVPAHILKRRQEEAERLGELTEQLNKVDIKSDDKGRKENGESSKSGVGSSEKVQENSPNKDTSNEIQDLYDEAEDENSPNKEISNNIKDLFDEAEGDRLLLEAGENICEFNGEQFIIPRE